LIELELASDPAASLCLLHHLLVKVATMPAEQVEAMSDRVSRAAEDPRRLSMRDFGNEVPHQKEREVRLAQAAIGAEGLDGEEAPALLAHEALDEAAVAAAEVEAAALNAEVAGRGRGTGGRRTERRLESHSKSPPGRAPVNVTAFRTASVPDDFRTSRKVT